MNRYDEFFRIECGADGVAVLTWNLQDHALNVFTEGALRCFEGAIVELIADPAVTGVVIASGKAVFHAGTDLAMAQRLTGQPADRLFADVMRINQVLRMMETGGKTFAAAINGHALGAGFEMALACHARFVADDPALQLGLPDINVGIMPGLGGTQRLPRLIPLADAVSALVQGVALTPEKALQRGAITRIVAAIELLDHAKSWVRQNPGAKQSWDRSGYKLASGAVHAPANFQFFVAASAQSRKATNGNYPAPQAILEAVYQGLQMPIEQALKVEARRFVSIARSSVAQAMTRTLRIGMSDTDGFKLRPADAPQMHFLSPVEKTRLTEIIAAASARPETLIHAFDFAQVFGKSPLDVNDGRSLFASRVVRSYMMEGMALLCEGVKPALIDNAGKLAGMPLGPLQLADRVNLDLIVTVADRTAAGVGVACVDAPGMLAARRMVALGRLGETAGAGFYDHADDERLWSGLDGEFPIAADQPDVATVKARLMTIQAIETLRCFDDGILKTPHDADLGSILGWGFPPFTGGVASYIDEVGAIALHAQATAFAATAGKRFTPPEKLKHLLASKTTLYTVSPIVTTTQEIGNP